jgi:hypothetical protein
MALVVHDNFTTDNILDCIDSGLDAFGTTVKNVIYFRFKTIFDLDRRDILRKPEAFRECLIGFFGERAFNIEMSIVAQIVERFHLPEVNLSDSMVRAVVEARKQIWSD